MVEEDTKDRDFKAKLKKQRTEAESEALEILRGKLVAPEAVADTADVLRKFKRFSNARRILSRASTDDRLDQDRKFRLNYFQKWALCTYKDTDLPAEQRLEDALRILRRADDIKNTRDQETLGLLGAIYKRKWEVDNRTKNLEISLHYYGRGMNEGSEHDGGYNAINAAFILDLLAYIDDEVLRQTENGGGKSQGADVVSSDERREKAEEIRESILSTIIPLKEKFRKQWWYYATLAEAFFGLGRYDDAVMSLQEGDEAVEYVEEWEKESTICQLALLAQIQSTARKRESVATDAAHSAGEEPELENLEQPLVRQEPDPNANSEDLREKIAPEKQNRDAWQALEYLFGGDVRAVRSAFNGKIGLALSGGGFRASLFHIGTLAKLAELDVLRQVEVLSCVSGGSIIGAQYYLEVRNLLQTKPDQSDPGDEKGPGAVTKQDYIDLVDKIAKDFLSGVERNIRTRVLSSWISSLKMAVFPNYSRTTRLGELYEKELFSKVRDGLEKKKRYINSLFVHPMGEDEDFHPRENNWRRCAKVPDLILNATALNTGHLWQFTCSWMGEAPANLEEGVDKNDRLRRMYYSEAPPEHQNVRLGEAVAASSCVPAAFEPLTFKNLYPERIVRLVDGGVCDNQGIAGLLEQDCSVILVSDASGQMDSENYPSDGLLGVPLRSNSILQSRIRDIQYNDLKKREASSQLRGLMFIHLKEGIDANQVDWINCPEPYYSENDSRARLSVHTPYGIDKKLQARLASIRTDLDSFSEIEAYTLMTSAYRMTGHAFATNENLLKLVPIGEEDGSGATGDIEWDFLRIERGMKGAGRNFEQDLFGRIMKYVGTSDQMAFRVLSQSKSLLSIGIAAGLTLVLGVLYQTGIAGFVFLWLQTPGVVVTILAGLGVAFGVCYLWKKVNWMAYLSRIGLGLIMLGPGWLLARIHLYTLDKLFLKLGRIPENPKK